LATFRCNGNESGFSLAETIIATGILAASIAGLGQLFAISVLSNRTARNTTFASVLATQKMEQLRGLTYGFDTLGLPLTDTSTNLAVNPLSPTGGKGLSPSPTGALRANTDGYVDYLDVYGKTVGTGGSTIPNGTTYIRRWSIEPLPTNPNNTVVLQVMVTRSTNRGSADAGKVDRLPDEARIITVKTRKAT
jgi:type II secretory pathway pseudopilin PulG